MTLYVLQTVGLSTWSNIQCLHIVSCASGAVTVCLCICCIFPVEYLLGADLQTLFSHTKKNTYTPLPNTILYS